jgi:hypothetical protein
MEPAGVHNRRVLMSRAAFLSVVPQRTFAIAGDMYQETVS